MYLISLTWHSSKERLSKIKWSHRFYDKDYLINVREPYIARFLDWDEYFNFVYISGQDNEVYPDLPDGYEYVIGRPHEFKRFHDSQAGYMVAASYALANGMDWVYIEQDCLVYGLNKALEWAKKQDKVIIYGYEPYNFAANWAEQSFMYVRNDKLPGFLDILNRSRIHENMRDTYPELLWHRMFGGVAGFWNFGYGRTRPIDFSQDVFYAQQLMDWEIDRFLKA